MGKRPAGVEGQRREHGERAAVEVGVGGLALGLVELGEVVDVHAGRGELRQDVVRPGLARLAHEPVGELAAGDELLGRRHAVDREVGDAGLDLLAQAGDAHHEELAQVRAQDREELDALDQRVALVLGLFEHAALEGQHAELAVDVEGAVGEVDGGGRFGGGRRPGGRGRLVRRVAGTGRGARSAGRRRGRRALARRPRRKGVEDRVGMRTLPSRVVARLVSYPIDARGRTPVSGSGARPSARRNVAPLRRRAALARREPCRRAAAGPRAGRRGVEQAPVPDGAHGEAPRDGDHDQQDLLQDADRLELGTGCARRAVETMIR